MEEGVTGARLTSEYAYAHGYWDPEEREFRGFGRVDRKDSEDYDTWVASTGGRAEESTGVELIGENAPSAGSGRGVRLKEPKSRPHNDLLAGRGRRRKKSE